MKPIAILILLLSSASFVFSQTRCRSNPISPDETTHFGGTELVSLCEMRPLRAVRGVVRDVNGDPINDVLIEVFTKPEWILEGKFSPTTDQGRIAATKTNSHGQFCLPNINAGSYELRASVGTGWNVSHVHIKVAPKTEKAKKHMVIWMSVGI
jgi:protocatechuate 3,4-dioxygenase beta subunit